VAQPSTHAGPTGGKGQALQKNEQRVLTQLLGINQKR
jgi:hypothetical protein